MPRPSLKVKESELSIGRARATLEKEEEVNAMLKKLAGSQPCIDTLTTNEALSWAFAQCPVSVVECTIQLMKDVGHLGLGILTRCIEYVAKDDSECKQMKHIVEPLMAHRHALPTEDHPVMLATPYTECVCEAHFESGECKFSKSNVYTMLWTRSKVPVLRIYCRDCNRVNRPFCADKHNQTATRKSKKKVKEEEEEGEPEDDEESFQERIYYNYKDISFIMGNRANYFSTALCEFYANNIAHAWVSAQGFSETFNEAMNNLRRWHSPGYSMASDKFIDRKVLGKAYLEHEIWRELIENQNVDNNAAAAPANDVGTPKRALAKKKHVRPPRGKVVEPIGSMKSDTEHAKKAGAAACLKTEQDIACKSTSRSTKFSLIRGLKVDNYLRSAQFRDRGIYTHKETPVCIKHGCQWIGICDGNWKIQYPLCMFQEMRQGLNGASISMNCKQEPYRRRAFCEKHCKLMEQKGFPTDVRQFIESCKSKKGQATAVNAMLEDFTRQRENATAKLNQDGAEANEAVNGHISDADELLSDDEKEQEDIEGKPKRSRPFTRTMAKKEMLSNVQEKLVDLAEIEGTTMPISSSIPMEWVEDDDSLENKLIQMVDIEERAKISKCFKNTGGKKRMNHWLRGHFFIVTPCGQIMRWEPLYGSESPSQAFLIMMDHLKIVLAHIEKADWYKYTLVYDNMCNVAGMKIAQKPLPTHSLEGQELYNGFENAFLEIHKVIDNLHLSNHVDPNCKKEHNPSVIEELHPDITVNTMRAEETFVWLSRFKKILCAQPKSHHHFYLHRLITRRNQYTQWNHFEGRMPLLPNVRSVHTK